ncbi:MAG: hypothetical protein ACT4N9_02530 [Paracoccaceae bacterium]
MFEYLNQRKFWTLTENRIESGLTAFGNDFDSAFKIYVAGDQVLSQRIQAFLSSQSFFLVAFGAFVLALRENVDSARVPIISLIILAMTICILHAGRMLSVHRKLIHLNVLLQKKSALFKWYMDGGESGHTFAYSYFSPVIFGFFWISSFFWVVCGV